MPRSGAASNKDLQQPIVARLARHSVRPKKAAAVIGKILSSLFSLDLPDRFHDIGQIARPGDFGNSPRTMRLQSLWYNFEQQAEAHPHD